MLYSNNFEQRCLQSWSNGPLSSAASEIPWKTKGRTKLETIYGQRTIHFHSDIYELELHYQHVIIMIIILHIEHVENNRFEKKRADE